MVEFERFLKNKVRKHNGDRLLDSTINQYLSFFYKHEEHLEVLKLDDEYVAYMNQQLKQKADMRLYAMFKFYLIFKNYDIEDKTEMIFKRIRVPKVFSGVANSQRLLESKVMSHKEMEILFEKSKDLWKLYFHFMYDTAARRNELLNIKFEQIEYTDEIEEYINSGVYAKIEIMGKGYKKRIVYLSKETVDLLKRFKQVAKSEYVFRFYNQDGKEAKKQDDALRIRIGKLCKTYLERHVHPHCFRHTKAQHLRDEGAKIEDISEYLGHSNSLITEKVYAKSSPKQGLRAFAVGTQ